MKPLKQNYGILSTQTLPLFLINRIKTRNIGACTKVMGRRNFQESIIVSINKTCLKHINWTMFQVSEDPLTCKINSDRLLLKDL